MSGDMEPIERAARAYCAARGWQPDEMVVAPFDPSGLAVMTWCQRWRLVADMLTEHVAHQAALGKAMQALVGLPHESAAP